MSPGDLNFIETANNYIFTKCKELFLSIKIAFHSKNDNNSTEILKAKIENQLNLHYPEVKTNSHFGISHFT